MQESVPEAAVEKAAETVAETGGVIDQIGPQLIEFATSYGLKIIGAILVLIVGRIVAGWAKKLVCRLLKKRDTDEAVVSFVGSLLYYMVIIFSWLAALDKFGVETASLVAVFGALASPSASPCRAR